jgi:hypothetical protein
VIAEIAVVNDKNALLADYKRSLILNERQILEIANLNISIIAKRIFKVAVVKDVVRLWFLRDDYRKFL